MLYEMIRKKRELYYAAKIIGGSGDSSPEKAKVEGEYFHSFTCWLIVYYAAF